VGGPNQEIGASGALTNVYHITYFEYGRVVEAYFRGCNFDCKGCSTKSSDWDLHLNGNARRFPSVADVPLLSLSDFSALISSIEAELVVLSGGGEPTMDRELPDVIRRVKDLGKRAILITNGHLINEGLASRLSRAGLDTVYVSIKAFNENKHKFFTGQSNLNCLRSLGILKKTNIDLRVGTILIPGLVDCYEIERIARFIEGIDPSIPLGIAPYAPVPVSPWRRPTKAEVDEAEEHAKRHLRTVYKYYGDEPILGTVRVLYPRIFEAGKIPAA
jgi:pyruvate formate lyase activating enzyme